MTLPRIILENKRNFIDYSVPDDKFQIILDKYHNYSFGWSVWRHFHRRRIEKVRFLLGEYFQSSRKSNERFALDLGCGKGPGIVLLEQNSFQKIYAIDNSDAELKAAKQLTAEVGVKNINFYNSTVETVILPDNYFDVILCSEVLEHLSQPQLGIRIIEKKLKPGGIAIISMPNLLSGYYMFGLLIFIVKYKFLKMSPYPTEYVKHLKYTYFSICNMIKKNRNLDIIDRRGCYYYPFPAKFLRLLGSKYPGFIKHFDYFEDSYLEKSIPYFGGSLFLVVRKM